MSDLLSLCAWRITPANSKTAGFTTEFEQALAWLKRGAAIAPLHQPSEEGLAVTDFGVIQDKAALVVPMDSWGGVISGAAATASDGSLYPPMTRESAAASVAPLASCACTSSPDRCCPAAKREFAERESCPRPR